MKISPAQEYKQNNLSPMVEYSFDIEEYIHKHINEEHDYSYANDERDYDLCLYCDCRRYNNSNKWVVEE